MVGQEQKKMLSQPAFSGLNRKNNNNKLLRNVTLPHSNPGTSDIGNIKPEKDSFQRNRHEIIQVSG